MDGRRDKKTKGQKQEDHRGPQKADEMADAEYPGSSRQPIVGPLFGIRGGLCYVN